jgi:hypothetical protein
MLRTIFGIIAGLLTWTLLVTLMNWGLRRWMPGYAEAEPAMAFSLGMQIARLLMAMFASLLAGAAVRAVAPRSVRAPWIAGAVLVALFVPAHVHLWERFPLWYHLTFLLTLAPLIALGARFASRPMQAQLDRAQPRGVE